MTENEVRDIPLGIIEPNPDQPRKTFPPEHIERLAASIAKRGLLQPISVKPLKPERYMIVAGECRWRAHILLNAATIRAIIMAIDAQETQLLALMENLLRRDMNPIEEANAFKTLLDEGRSIDWIGAELGLSAVIVRRRLDLLDLSDGLQQLVASGNLPFATAWGIAIAPKEHQMKILRDVQSGRLRTAEQARHAGIALRDAAAQMDAFASAPVATKSDLAALTRLEQRIDEMTEFVAAGFKNGECVAAQRVSPDRVTTMADKLALIRKHVQFMEHDLRCVATQLEIKMEVAS